MLICCKVTKLSAKQKTKPRKSSVTVSLMCKWVMRQRLNIFSTKNVNSFVRWWKMINFAETSVSDLSCTPIRMNRHRQIPGTQTRNAVDGLHNLT